VIHWHVLLATATLGLGIVEKDWQVIGYLEQINVVLNNF